ncbi:MAG: hypothetical protein ACRDV9_02860 [Acidimicrobiia bacterium]
MLGIMNKYWAPPEKEDRSSEHGYDAWFDVWVEDDGSVATHLGLNDEGPALAALGASMLRSLEELLSGRVKRTPNGRNPSGEVDLGQGVVILRVVHQRNGEVSCGWGRLAADPALLRPLRELAAVASQRLAGSGGAAT